VRYKTWVNNTQGANPAPIFIDVFLYNVTNPLEVLAGGKPNLEEIGPFVYEEITSRFNISFEDGGESVQFRQNVYYVSRPSLSVTNANDAQVTAFNLVTQGLFAKLKGTVYMPLLPHLLTGSDFDKFFVVKSVSEMLFGYPDSVLNTLHSFVPDLCPYTRYPGLMINQTMEEAMASQLPNKMNTGWKTGLASGQVAEDMFQVTQWQNSSSLSIWGSPAANKVTGTFGLQFQPNLPQGTLLEVFVPLLKRSNVLEQTGHAKVDGIPVRVYQPSVQGNANASVNLSNAGYYAFGPNGVINETAAQENVPVFFSQPHFYLGATSLQEGVTGMRPPLLPAGPHLPYGGARKRHYHEGRAAAAVQPTAVPPAHPGQQPVPLGHLVPQRHRGCVRARVLAEPQGHHRGA
jgi:hypothetical protein